MLAVYPIELSSFMSSRFQFRLFIWVQHNLAIGVQSIKYQSKNIFILLLPFRLVVYRFHFVWEICYENLYAKLYQLLIWAMIRKNHSLFMNCFVFIFPLLILLSSSLTKTFLHFWLLKEVANDVFYMLISHTLVALHNNFPLIRFFFFSYTLRISW